MLDIDAPVPPGQRHFLIEEYKTLRAEIEMKIKDNRKLEFYAVTASAAIFSWLASRTEQVREFARGACLAPALLRDGSSASDAARADGQIDRRDRALCTS